MPESTEAATVAEVELARRALLDVTSASTIGEPAGSVVGEDGVVTLYFATTMGGYPGWRWTVSIARVAGDGPSVLETELTPGEGALLSPDWVPWADRLAEYKEAKAAGLEGDAGESDPDHDDGDDDDRDDEDDDDEDDLLPPDDLDGVDLDGEFAEAGTEPGARAGTERSAAVAVGDDDADEPEGESDDAAPEPPVTPRRRQRAKKQQQDDEGDQPEG